MDWKLPGTLLDALSLESDKNERTGGKQHERRTWGTHVLLEAYISLPNGEGIEFGLIMG